MMKFTSQSESLKRLRDIKRQFQTLIRTRYEPKAKNCLTCEVQGSCCTDAHFVNVHITRLEAVAIREALGELDEARQREIYARAADAVRKYNLGDSDDSFRQTFACPLFEKGTGCLAHKSSKPVPCIQHACYENREDLPPDELQTENENSIERLNAKTYGRNWSWLPLPVWLGSMNPFLKNKE